MNGTTILLWITIFIIGVIAIILVKLHYTSDKLEKDEGSILPSTESINRALNNSMNMFSKDYDKKSNDQNQLTSDSTNLSENPSYEEYDIYIVPENEKDQIKSAQYESPNQLLINYGNEVEKTQEPISEKQMMLMTGENNSEKHELKDLFTIDELIEESKRKDSEREKESQTISKAEDDDLTELKESIKRKQEESSKNIEEAIDESLKEEKDITEIINEETGESIEITQKDIEEAIESINKEKNNEPEIISESENITDVLLKSEENNKTEEIITETKTATIKKEDNKTEEILTETKENIQEPTLKTPKKVEEKPNKESEPEPDFDLDYRKDLAKFKSKIKDSKIYGEVKDKLVQEPDLDEYTSDETYIRNVNEYDEYAPIINETHIDADASYEELHDADIEKRLREENSRKVFNITEKEAKSETAEIKNKPARDNIKIELNNDTIVLKKGDEIIFNHDGETYSSQVYAINGDDISVKYRRKNIKIKPKDVKKIY